MLVLSKLFDDSLSLKKFYSSYKKYTPNVIKREV